MLNLENDGYALTDLVLSERECENLSLAIPGVTGGRAGVRNLIAHPTVLALLRHPRFGEYIWSVIGRNLVAVKATLFDKTPEASWRAQWHQDRVLAVKERLDVPGYGPWSTKGGSLHVDAPAQVLAQMIAVRIHFDVCGADNGPLRVIPGSHRKGKVSAAAMSSIVSSSAQVELCVPRGAILLMRPLLIHSSSPSVAVAHRRVLHIEFAPVEAISPLQWEAAIPLRRAA